MRLSKRLRAISDMIVPYVSHGSMADIGSDHGYLPVDLVLRGVVDRAIACDIADGPLQACLSTVQLSHTEDKISVKKGNGLEPIIGDQLDVVSICGMGGNLICDILDAHLAKVEIGTLIIEANVNEPMVRLWLNQHHWRIVNEKIVADAGHFYEIIAAQNGEQLLTAKEIYFGPCLLKQKNDTFFDKWQWQKSIHQHILKTLPSSHEKYAQVVQEYQWIQEVLS